MLTRIIGIGNSWASDDGVGPELARRFEARLAAEPEPARQVGPIEFLTIGQPGLGLLEAMHGCQTLIIIDAVSSGAAPGTLHRLDWQAASLDSRGVERASSHGFGVREVLELAASLGRLPDRVILWGIEIASTEPGHGLSPDVAAALPGLVDRLRQELLPREVS